MPNPSNDKNLKKDEALFKRPAGVLLDEKHWGYPNNGVILKFFIQGTFWKFSSDA